MLNLRYLMREPCLARSMKQLIETVETLRLWGIGFRSLTEALDTTTAQGRLVFHMFGALAEFERSKKEIGFNLVSRHLTTWVRSRWCSFSNLKENYPIPI